MDYEYYLEKFRKSADQLNKEMLKEKHLDIYVGVTLNSVVLKLYKKEWTNDKIDPINAKTRIFFAIWVNDETIKRNKVFYNIHALKLRELKGYSITSRDFANSFREDFMKFKQDWENVSVKFGPLTLMEGWEQLEHENLEKLIVKLANNFSSIAHLIDHTIEKFDRAKITKSSPPSRIPF
ncbi:hypothetical protein COR50_15025 [Chitinophaga caeni]|uniref:Uncharacterized protein n=1 Tax=Chitinophaga caeni TaxID=2029983 RepID=A0A291QWQ5_9BACT|nr:hypothetical protein [Chitinophaga caeni]ATL48367.1 hypothetical protein COR50_15025 [Chitinophaga caeni]